MQKGKSEVTVVKVTQLLSSGQVKYYKSLHISPGFHYWNWLEDSGNEKLSFNF